MIAKTMFGFESVLANELLQLGAMDVKEGTRMVSFVGDKGFMYKANLCLRTALKILKPYKSFKVHSEKDLYDQIYALPWEDFMGVDDSLAIDTAVHSEVFTHSQYVALKVKDAIVDRFREKFGRRPNVDLKHPTLRINIHIEKQFCNVSFDSSGSSLHKRGYRSSTNIAPINEVLAAGMLLLSGWKGQCDFLDPMCGSGTIPIEAAMIACNIPPNINRKEFAFEKWKDWDNELFETIEESVKSKEIEFEHKLYGFDISSAMIKKAEKNIEISGLGVDIEIVKKDFLTSIKTDNDKLHVLINPPYDKRISADVNQLYKKIGDTLKNNYLYSDVWIITANLEAIKSIGLKSSKKIKLFNANLESRLLNFKIYPGSKKQKD